MWLAIGAVLVVGVIIGSVILIVLDNINPEPPDEDLCDDDECDH